MNELANLVAVPAGCERWQWAKRRYVGYLTQVTLVSTSSWSDYEDDIF